MKVAFNGVECELDMVLTDAEAKFYKKMESNGFIFTYYPNKDTKPGSIEKITLKLRNKVIK